MLHSIERLYWRDAEGIRIVASRGLNRTDAGLLVSVGCPAKEDRGEDRSGQVQVR